MVKLIDEIKREYKVTLKYCCKVLKLDIRRYKRWITLYKRTGRYGGGKPGPRHAPHALLKEERQRIIEMARSKEHENISHRQLSVVASEKGIVEVSASSFYREMKKEDLISKGETKANKKKVEKPKIEVDGPNKVWSWDLCYIPLGFVFVYLFAIIDLYSRKIVGWHLSLNATVNAMKIAWDNALVNEGLLGKESAPKMPIALSDHGVQMAKKSAREFFKDLGIKQLFARYQTPTDNAWIESWFKTLKYEWLRFKDYISFTGLKKIIEEFIYIYNNIRYHGAIGYVTPQQKHSGEAEKILSLRAERRKLARERRLKINRELYQSGLRKAA